MAYINGNKVFTVVRTTEAPVDVPNKQATVSIVVNALTNINGRLLTTYEATEQTIGDYEVIKITKSGENVTEAEAITYMQYMTGSKFLPKYDLDKPQYSLFIFADFTVWKPQYDETNGLLLYKTGYKLATENDVEAVVEALKTGLENGEVIPLITKNIAVVSEESGSTQETPFIFQGTGTDNNTSETPTSPVGKQLEKQGNTICVNQLVQNSNFDNNNDWTCNGGSFSVSNNVASITASQQYCNLFQSIKRFANHKYLLLADVKVATLSSSIGIFIVHNGSSWVQGATPNSTSWKTYSYILNQIDDDDRNDNTRIIQDNRTSDWNEIQVKNVYCIDLTQWFGSNDLIPQDLLDNPSHFINYYNGSLAYNTGELKNCDGEVLECVEFNQFNINAQRQESYAQATIDGTKITITGTYYCAWKIDLIPENYFVRYDNLSGTGHRVVFHYIDGTITPQYTRNNVVTLTKRADYIYLYCSGGSQGTCVYDKVCINLHWDGQRDGEYQPYVKHSYNTGSEVLRSAGSVKDVKTPDGTITRKVGVVDLSTLTWNGSYYTNDLASLIKIPASTSIIPNVITSNNYNVKSEGSESGIAGSNDLFITSSGSLVIRASTTPSGYLYYELATPTTEQGTSFSENIEIDDYGTMGWKNGNDEYVEIPQGCKIFYPADYVLLMDDLYNYTNGDVTKLAKKSDIVTPNAPSVDGTYTLKVTVSSGTVTYSWVLDE